MRKVIISLVVVFSTSYLLAQTTVSGTVTDEAGKGLPGANVLVTGTELGTSTDRDGNYSLSLPSNLGASAKVTVRYIGYKTSSVNVDLTGGPVTQDFSLAEDILKMDAVLVTGLSGVATKAKRPFAIERVESDVLELAPSTTVESMIRGKMPGVQVVNASGIPGTSASVQLRAPTSINSSGRSQSPLFIVDNIVIDPSVSGSPMSDLDPDDIESIEVVKGASASSMYGSQAANGVISIITKRGKQLALGDTKFRVKIDRGSNDMTNRNFSLNRSHWYTLNSDGEFVDASGNVIDPRSGNQSDNLDAYTDSSWGSAIYFSDNPYKWVSTGGDKVGDDWVWDTTKSLTALPGSDGFDQLDKFFNDLGGYQKTSFSMSRNAENYNFHAAVNHHLEDGLFSFMRGFERTTLRFNSDVRLPYNITLGLSNFVSRSHLDDMDEYTGSPFFDILFFAPSADLDLVNPTDGNPFIAPDPTNTEEANPLYQIRTTSFSSERSRVLSGLNLKWNVRPDVLLGADLSYDRSDRFYREYYPKGYKTPIPSATLNDGWLAHTKTYDQAVNAGISAIYSKHFGDLGLTASFRKSFEDRTYRNTYARGYEFAVGDLPDLDASAEQYISSTLEEVRSMGQVLGGQLDYADKYLIDVSTRTDESSLFGPTERKNSYYRFSGAYRISQEPFWPLGGLVNEFKLRFSQGTSGNRPSFSAQYETWSVSAGSISKGNLGNKDLKPEFATETEMGLDMVIMDRFSVALTTANTIVKNQILPVPLAGYYGYSNQWQNAGTLETTALELALEAYLMKTSDMSLTSGFNYSKITQKITEFDKPGYLYSLPGTQSMKIFYMRDDEDYGSIYGNKFITSVGELPSADQSYASLFQVNDDGYLVYVGSNSYTDGISGLLWGRSAADAAMGDTALSADYDWGMPIMYAEADGNQTVKLGAIVPDFIYSFNANFRFKGLSVYALFDGQSGGHIYNMTQQWGYREGRAGEVDQTGKADGKKKPTLYYQILYNVRNPSSHFVHDGSYLKMRELSVRFDLGSLPQLAQMGLGGMTIGMVGRNLMTWSDYIGYDPEVGIPGGNLGSAVVGRFDSYQYPNYKTLSFVLEAEF